MVVTLTGGSLSVVDVMRVAEANETVAVNEPALKRMEKFRAMLEERVAKGEVIYGVNTGFGSLSDKVIPAKEVQALQLNLIRSHSVGVGEPLPRVVVRAAMVIRLNGMLRGNSAVRPQVAMQLLGMLNAGVTPFVPSYGSLGASGDLAPSAHMALAMVGEGRAYLGSEPMPSGEALARAKMKPIELSAKEGLSLINGTCFSTALACVAVHRGWLLLESANAAVALAGDVLGACEQEFDDRLMRMRHFEGQQHVAAQIREMLKGSARTRGNPIPQDPYSIRCAPQVHGSAREALVFAQKIVDGEANAVTDNPVFAPDGEVLHGGNFHAQPVSMAMDLLALAVSYLGVMSLARIHLLMTSSPEEHKFMANRPGLESGLMVAEYTASALAAENAKEVYPLSSYPANVSQGVEDHASYGVNTGLKAVKVCENVAKMLSIELVCSSNLAKSFEGDLSPYDAKVLAFVRSVMPPLTSDKSISSELERLAAALLTGAFPHAKGREHTSTPSLKTDDT